MLPIATGVTDCDSLPYRPRYVQLLHVWRVVCKADYSELIDRVPCISQGSSWSPQETCFYLDIWHTN